MSSQDKSFGDPTSSREIVETAGGTFPADNQQPLEQIMAKLDLILEKLERLERTSR